MLLPQALLPTARIGLLSRQQHVLIWACQKQETALRLHPQWQAQRSQSSDSHRSPSSGFVAFYNFFSCGHGRTRPVNKHAPARHFGKCFHEFSTRSGPYDVVYLARDAVISGGWRVWPRPAAVSDWRPSEKSRHLVNSPNPRISGGFHRARSAPCFVPDSQPQASRWGSSSRGFETWKTSIASHHVFVVVSFVPIAVLPRKEPFLNVPHHLVACLQSTFHPFSNSNDALMLESFLHPKPFAPVIADWMALFSFPPFVLLWDGRKSFIADMNSDTSLQPKLASEPPRCKTFFHFVKIKEILGEVKHSGSPTCQAKTQATSVPAMSSRAGPAATTSCY